METNQQLTVKALFGRDTVKQKFTEMLGKKAQGFITSVLQITSQNSLLAKADPNSVLQSAMMAATLDLPLNNNLGFAYIIPYKAKNDAGQYIDVAQFQIGYKGFIQLAQRSGQFKTISAAPIYEGQLVEQNPLTGFRFDFSTKESDTVIGYAAHFALLNGFEKTLYMTVDELKKHGTRFSQTFKKGFGLWKDDFDSMAQKTVIKMLLSKFAPMSIEMQKAVITDQAVINNVETEDISYIDNDEPEVNHEQKRLASMINDATTPEDLKAIEVHLEEQPELLDLFTTKQDELKSKSKKAA